MICTLIFCKENAKKATQRNQASPKMITKDWAMTKANESHKKLLNDLSYEADFEAIAKEFELLLQLLKSRIW